MATYVLVCDCGSTDFYYDGIMFNCNNCGESYSENEAGLELVAVEDTEADK